MDFQKKDWQFRDVISEGELNRIEDGIEEGIAKAEDAKTSIESHENRQDNPHNVTKQQVGLGNVQNYGIATEAEATAGTASNKYMTPQRTKQAIDALQAVKSVNGKTGAVTITKGDIGLGNVDNVKQASKTEFDSHVGNTTIHVTQAEKNDWNAKETPEGAQQKADQAEANAKQYSTQQLAEHKADKENPHNVTKSQVGLGNVQNYGIATQAEAEEGAANNKYMTPQRTKQAIDANVFSDNVQFPGDLNVSGNLTVNDYVYVGNRIRFPQPVGDPAEITQTKESGRSLLMMRGAGTAFAAGAGAIYLYGPEDSESPGNVHIYTNGNRAARFSEDQDLFLRNRLIFEGTQQIRVADNSTFSIMDLSGNPILDIRGNVTENNYKTIRLLGLEDFTVSSSANVHVTSSYNIARTTSARKYKKDIEPIKLEYARRFFDNAVPVWYRSRGTVDPKGYSYYGYIADDVAKFEPRLVQFNESGEPEGFNYDRVPALLHVIMKDFEEQLKKQAQQIAILQTQIEQLRKELEDNGAKQKHDQTRS